MRMLFGMNARIRVVYYQEIPKKGGFILASNHISHFDPPIITPLFPRRIDWIGMSDLFRGRILRGFFTGVNVIPIARNEADRAALAYRRKATPGGARGRNLSRGRNSRWPWIDH